MFMNLSEHVKIIEAAKGLTRAEFEAAQRRARPTLNDDDYLEGLWIQWRRGGLPWLAARTFEGERDEVFAAVQNYGREDGMSRQDRAAERELLWEVFGAKKTFRVADLRDAHVVRGHTEGTLATWRRKGLARPLKGSKGTWETQT
jgi:hypothetical protein